MLELTVANANDYLRERGWIAAPAVIEELSGGVSNQVLRATTSEGHFVLKQSRPQLRTRDAWFSDLERIYREQEVMQALHPHLPDVVPEVLFVDRDNFVYAMSHAPLEARVWKSQLLAGQVNIELGHAIGSVLGRMHQASVDDTSTFRRFRDHTVYVQLRVDPFYVRVQERCPDVAAAIALIIEEMVTRKDALCHGDYTPKNMLVHQNGFTLVDYETAHVGDPTMDLGLLLAHLTLKVVRSPADTSDLIALMRSFWHSYVATARFAAPAELERRGTRHLGVCLLARIDGTSPVDYLNELAKKDFVRKMGRKILLDGMNRWEEIWTFLGHSSGSASGVNSMPS